MRHDPMTRSQRPPDPGPSSNSPFARCQRTPNEGSKKIGGPDWEISHPPSDPPRLPPPRSGFATNRDGRGTSPYRTAGRAAASAAGGGVKRSSVRRVFVGEGGGALSRDIRRSKARTRSATPGERGGPPACSATKPAATSSDGGDDDIGRWVNPSVGLPAADPSGDCIVDVSIEAETEELAVRVEWYDGSLRTSNARKGGPLPLPEPPPPTPNSSSRPARDV
jgi:hypothetical protein